MLGAADAPAPPCWLEYGLDIPFVAGWFKRRKEDEQ